VLPVILCQRLFIILFSSVVSLLSLSSLRHIIILNLHFATVLYGYQKYFCCKEHFYMSESMYLMLANKVYLCFEGKTVYLLYVCVWVGGGGGGSVVYVATGYGLDGPGIESRWGARLSAPVQTDPGAHPASFTMGTRSFPGVKSGRGMTLSPHPLLVPWS